jgi:hypothetical protein
VLVQKKTTCAHYKNHLDSAVREIIAVYSDNHTVPIPEISPKVMLRSLVSFRLLTTYISLLQYERLTNPFI